jgi:hypothetical protein
MLLLYWVKSPYPSENQIGGLKPKNFRLGILLEIKYEINPGTPGKWRLPNHIPNPKSTT